MVGVVEEVRASEVRLDTVMAAEMAAMVAAAAGVVMAVIAIAALHSRCNRSHTHTGCTQSLVRHRRMCPE